MMAERARGHEADLWVAAGLQPGSRVVDVGCGPGAMVAPLADVVGPGGHVVGVDADPDVVRHRAAARAGNGGAEQRIVDHLAARVRPGGHVYLLDVDMASAPFPPPVPPLAELGDRYHRWHTWAGNDTRAGRRLAALSNGAGLDVLEFRGCPSAASSRGGCAGRPGPHGTRSSRRVPAVHHRRSPDAGAGRG